jgi:hypothetical protein
LRETVDIVAMTERTVVADALKTIHTMKGITEAVDATRRGAGRHAIDFEQPKKEVHLLSREHRPRQVRQKIKGACLESMD